jgi:hypothetical protein
MTMRFRFRRTPRLAGAVALTAITLVALLGLLPAAAFAQQAAWLDAAPRNWNTAGAAVPAAPPPAVDAPAQCGKDERAAQGVEETQVAQAGWRLESFWPSQRASNVALVMALSGYDGMCRPLGFNGFVFADGHFAGTISPMNMNSRADGALRNVPTLAGDSSLEAFFTRYAPTDPLCCPSKGATPVSYRVGATAAGPVLVPVRIGTTPGSVQLPRTGSAGAGRTGPFSTAPAVLVVGATCLLAGWALRRRICAIL